MILQIPVNIPVNLEQAKKAAEVKGISLIDAVREIALKNIRSGYGKIDEVQLKKLVPNTVAVKSDAVHEITLSNFITYYQPFSANKFPLDEEITREDVILSYYTVGTKESAKKLQYANNHVYPTLPTLTPYLWVIIVEAIGTEIVVKILPYKEGGMVLTKYQDLQGYIVTLKSHDNENIIVTLSN